MVCANICVGSPHLRCSYPRIHKRPFHPSPNWYLLPILLITSKRLPYGYTTRAHEGDPVLLWSPIKAQKRVPSPKKPRWYGQQPHPVELNLRKLKTPIEPKTISAVGCQKKRDPILFHVFPTLGNLGMACNRRTRSPANLKMDRGRAMESRKWAAQLFQGPEPP